MRSRVAELSGAGVSPGLVHVANSAGVLFHDGAGFDGARPGLALYGVSPSERGDGGIGLEPAMTLETRVMSVKEVPAGHPARIRWTLRDRAPVGDRRASDRLS